LPRTRYLKPEFFSDEDLAELPFQARLTFAGLWCYADRAGRLEDRPKFLKAMIFPYDNVDMEKQLETLSNGKHENGTPFVQRYEANGIKLLQIVKWDKHQKPHHSEKESIFPPPSPPNFNGDFNYNYNGEYHDDELEARNVLTPIKERPLPGKTPINKLTDDEFIQKLKENPAYKEIDIDQELGKIDAWLLTPRGAGKKKSRQRIVNWLNRVEKPIETNQGPPTDPMDRRMWEIEQARKKK